MKKIIAFLLVALFSVSLSGCSTVGPKDGPEFHPGHPGHEVH